VDQHIEEEGRDLSPKTKGEKRYRSGSSVLKKGMMNLEGPLEEGRNQNATFPLFRGTSPPGVLGEMQRSAEGE